MFKKYVFASSVAALCASVAVGAQTTGAQQSASDQQSQTTSGSTAQSDTASSSTGATTTLVGCVYKEADVPGRTPNVAERAGVMEDYILAEVQPGADSASAGATAGAEKSETVGTSGTISAGGKMYKLEHVADERLSSFVGKRVEVTGKIDADAGDQAAATGTTGSTAAPDQNAASPDRIDLPEFEVASIRETSGSCPAKPSAK